MLRIQKMILASLLGVATFSIVGMVREESPVNLDDAMAYAQAARRSLIHNDLPVAASQLKELNNLIVRLNSNSPSTNPIKSLTNDEIYVNALIGVIKNNSLSPEDKRVATNEKLPQITSKLLMRKMNL